jgi:phosphate transport system substrate-binding protein
MVGSSTVFPFAAAAAEEFGRSGGFKTPIVEATGTGGGFKLFCSSNAPDSPDFINASRPMKDSEKAMCTGNGVTDIVEIKLGYDGIVLAQKKGASSLSLTKQQLFLALAHHVPKDGKLIANPYQQWSDVDPRLPNTPIEIYGPPPTSGTRDAFVEMVMEKACKTMPEFAAAIPDEKARDRQCRMIREDGRYIEIGDNNNLIIQKLTNNTQALGIFGYSFLEQNLGLIQASSIDGVTPTLDGIVSGKYGISRSLFVYAKRAHTAHTPGLHAFAKELTSDEAMDPVDGYLVLKGLIPLPEKERAEMRAKALSGW